MSTEHTLEHTLGSFAQRRRAALFVIPAVAFITQQQALTRVQTHIAPLALQTLPLDTLLEYILDETGRVFETAVSVETRPTVGTCHKSIRRLATLIELLRAVAKATLLTRRRRGLVWR